MLKVNKLIELMDIADQNKADIPIGTIFEYKNNCYVVKKSNSETASCKGCDIRKEFIEELKSDSFDCGDNCPFGYWAVPTKLSEIEALILIGGKDVKNK